MHLINILAIPAMEFSVADVEMSRNVQDVELAGLLPLQSVMLMIDAIEPIQGNSNQNELRNDKNQTLPYSTFARPLHLYKTNTWNPPSSSICIK